MRTRLASVLSMTRLLTRAGPALALGLLTVLASPVAAQAAVPDHGSFFFTSTFVDSDVCAPEGFDVDVIETEATHYEVFFNADGSVKQVIVHVKYTAVISANGHTIYESDTWQEFFYPDGSKTVGLTVHIKGPAGIVQLDAGQIVFDADGAVTYIRGPHPQFEGQTFCFALLP
jgi:hypothetical protein